MGIEAEPIRIAAALILDAAGRTLMVRKRGTEALIQPGGKIEPGEAPEAALARELREELGCVVVEAVFVGAFAAPAVHEPGRRVEAMLFRVEIDGVPAAGEEIDALFWLSAAEAEARQLAPLSRTHVLPLVKAAAERIKDAA
ncbi:8-oxo-dGTP pyrophosphatase MutT (NUDIX family) [Sphingomonas naasensis]|uniref:NUDIX domain-containing protein n=1 Tax=Sphingomonas naasensis TaxID=1344951 RepID=A0A4S1WRM8_9SPHN|nr:NUDIX domain-containing protein [Sphingomonas naasensis]NIJ18806.1 8-oxo-dGTP pyrophosphatase MutT (NUDIX family) [Sphingomonas naasensis]TGX46034.1 NUDIX domain-containing protein [Sphingomonas naasensis]